MKSGKAYACRTARPSPAIHSNLFILLGILFLVCGGPHAVSASDFLINPMIVQGAVTPGNSETAEYTLWSKYPGTYEITVEQAWPRPGKGKNPYPVSEWFHLDRTEVSLEADGTTTVPFVVAARKNARGEVAARLTITHKPGTEGAPMTVSTAFSPVIYVTFKGTEDVRGRLKDFAWGYLPETQSVKFAWGVESQGNVHLRPREEILIRTPEGEEVKKLEIPIRNLAFPGETVFISETMPLSELEHPDQEYEVELKVYYGEIYGQPDLVWTAKKRGRLDQKRP